MIKQAPGVWDGGRWLDGSGSVSRYCHSGKFQDFLFIFCPSWSFFCLFVFINNPTFRCAQYSTSSSAFLRDPLTYLALPVGAVCNHVTILGLTLDKRPKKLSSCVTHHATGEEENSKRGWKQSPSSTWPWPWQFWFKISTIQDSPKDNWLLP